MLTDANLAAAWSALTREFQRATTEKEHPFRFVVLSTVTEKNQPKARYVVLRNVTEDFTFWLYSDLRSNKVRDIQSNSYCQLLMFDPAAGIQVLVSGKAIIHSNTAVAANAWEMIPEEMKKPYTPLIAPGTVVDHPSRAHNWPDEKYSDHFCVIELKAASIEVLQLNGLAHYRAQFDSKDQWTGTWIAP